MTTTIMHSSHDNGGITKSIITKPTRKKDSKPIDPKPISESSFHVSKSVGCRHRKNIKVIFPQYEDCKRPSPLFGNAFVFTNHLFQCKYCPQIAKYKSTMEEHVRQHFPPKYPCDQCGDSFYSSTARLQHYLHCCSHCFKIFRGYANCCTHEKRCQQNPDRMVKLGKPKKQNKKRKNYEM